MAYRVDGDSLLRFASSFKLIPDSSHNPLILSAINASVSEVSILNLRLSRDNDAVIMI